MGERISRRLTRAVWPRARSLGVGRRWSEALRTLEADDREVLSAGKLIHPTRLAVTAKDGSSPGLFEVLELLGKERTLARLDRLLAQLNGRSSLS